MQRASDLDGSDERTVSLHLDSESDPATGGTYTGEWLFQQSTREEWHRRQPSKLCVRTVGARFSTPNSLSPLVLSYTKPSFPAVSSTQNFTLYSIAESLPGYFRAFPNVLFTSTHPVYTRQHVKKMYPGKNDIGKRLLPP